MFGETERKSRLRRLLNISLVKSSLSLPSPLFDQRRQKAAHSRNTNNMLIRSAPPPPKTSRFTVNETTTMVVEIVQAILCQFCTLVKPRFGLGRDGGGPGMYPFFFLFFGSCHGSVDIANFIHTIAFLSISPPPFLLLNKSRTEFKYLHICAPEDIKQNCRVMHFLIAYGSAVQQLN